MSRKWVVNASPLILLTKVSHISLLQELCNELVIPGGVAKEILTGPANDLTRIWLNEKGSPLILAGFLVLNVNTIYTTDSHLELFYKKGIKILKL